jgi:hypothetical protein
MSIALASCRHPSGALRGLIALGLALVALAASGVARADPPGRVGRIAEVDGRVWLYDDAQAQWIQALRNRPVTEGDRLSVEPGSHAVLQIGAATLRLDEGTEVEFEQLDDARVRARLDGGSLALRLRAARAERGEDSVREYAVLTREGSFEPLGAGRYRVDARDDGSFGAATSGSLRFESGDSLLDLQAGQRAEFWFEHGRTHYAWVAMPDDRFAERVRREERDEDRERDREPRYVSPEMTGGEDLERYGNWDRHPEYGAVWFPATVAVGWAPYRFGHWTTIGAWGWTWVDDAPWGFAPFHYGRWVHWNGRWGWCPGQYVARPVYAPALVGWFGSPQLGVVVKGGSSGPAVAWVPLAPREAYVPAYQVSSVYTRKINDPHQPWLPRQHAVPTGPISYGNQVVPGAVTAVPPGVVRSRQPISPAVTLALDPKAVAGWRAPASQPAAVPEAPPPGARRPTATTLPVAPNAPRRDAPAPRERAVQPIPPARQLQAPAAPPRGEREPVDVRDGRRGPPQQHVQREGRAGEPQGTPRAAVPRGEGREPPTQTSR